MSTFQKDLGQVTTVLGAQWGDEGKGKLVDILAQEYDVIARATGGANAGHTIYFRDENDEQKKIVFHLVPSGILHEGTVCIIGNGTVIHLPTLMDELQELRDAKVDFHDRLWISDRAHLIFDFHMLTDGAQEDHQKYNKIGTTKRGIGPAYGDKIARIGIRAHLLRDQDKLMERIRLNAERLQEIYGFEFDVSKEIVKYEDLADYIEPHVCDTTVMLNNLYKEGKSILIEGAQGAMLDIDHGTYPYVTSSNTTIGGTLKGLGMAPQKINSSIGIVKAYTTRVGEGPFPSELSEIEAEMLREQGGEFGATTGRPRRCGWFDAVVVKYSSMIDGYTHLNLTKLDVLTGFKNLKIAYKYTYNGEELESFPADLEILEACEVEYLDMPGWDEDISKVKKFSDLPQNAQDYVKKIEELVGVQVKYIGVGMYRDDLIVV